MKFVYMILLCQLILVKILPAQSFNEQWGAQGLRVSNVYGKNQQQSVICSDGSGGCFITWQDNRSGNWDIWLAKVNNSGAVEFTTAICSASGKQNWPNIVDDGLGGAYIAWRDYRTSGSADIYAQHIDSEGNTSWTQDGIVIVNASGTQYRFAMKANENGELLIAWRDSRLDSDYDIYVQKIDLNGTAQWTANGVSVHSSMLIETRPDIISDEAGGAIVTFQSNRWTTSGFGWGIYAARIKNNGSIEWTMTITDDYGYNEEYPYTVQIPGQGFVTIWSEKNAGSLDYDIFGQKISFNGTKLWGNDHLLIRSTNYQRPYWLSYDKLGYLYLISHDSQNGSNRDLTVQKVDTLGNYLWNQNGVQVCSYTGSRYPAMIVPDNKGGIIAVWRDYRFNNSGDIYCQKIDSNGTRIWGSAGTYVCNYSDLQSFSYEDNYIQWPFLTTDNNGGAIAVWHDRRWANSGYGYGVYVQRLNDNLADGPNSAVGWKNDLKSDQLSNNYWYNFLNPYF